jgi:hypothetical protein
MERTPTLFEAFYEACTDLGLCSDLNEWASMLGVLPSNARRYLCGSLRPRPERVQIWCEKIRHASGHRLTVILPPYTDTATLIIEPREAMPREVECSLYPEGQSPNLEGGA